METSFDPASVGILGILLAHSLKNSTRLGKLEASVKELLSRK